LVRPIGIRFREASTKVHHPGCSGLPVLTGILYPGGPPRPAYPISAVTARLGGGAASPGSVYPTPGWVGGGVGCLEEDSTCGVDGGNEIWGSLRSARESIEEASSSYSQVARPRGFLAQRRSCRAWGFLCFALESATHRARCLTSLSLKVSPGPPRLL